MNRSKTEAHLKAALVYNDATRRHLESSQILLDVFRLHYGIPDRTKALQQNSYQPLNQNHLPAAPIANTQRHARPVVVHHPPTVVRNASYRPPAPAPTAKQQNPALLDLKNPVVYELEKTGRFLGQFVPKGGVLGTIGFFVGGPAGALAGLSIGALLGLAAAKNHHVQLHNSSLL